MSHNITCLCALRNIIPALSRMSGIERNRTKHRVDHAEELRLIGNFDAKFMSFDKRIIVRTI